MSTILPDSTRLRNAIKWIAAQLTENPHQPLLQLIETASFKFDLNPAESIYLTRFYQKESPKEE